MIIQVNPGLIQLFVAIEALLVIVFGIIKGGLEARRLVFAGTAVIFAYALPFVLGHLIPGFGNTITYQLLQGYAEGAENTWGFVYQLSSKVMLIDASAMTALNIIEMLSTFGLASIPQQYMGVLMNLGWTLDPIDAIVESINHASQVLIAIFHTIAWLAWFSWAVAPTILGIALALIVLERTRPAGTAILLLTLAIMFFTSLAAYTLDLNKEAQLINSINNTLSVIENDLPQNMTVRGYLLLQSNYPYFVSGQLMNETMVCGPGGCHYVPEPISWFIGFTPSVGLIDQFAAPSINNVTLLWLSVNPNHQCNLLIWPPNRNITQLPEVEQCNPQLFDNNETFAEEIIIEGPHLNLIRETINGTVYTGAWEWINPPTSYTVSDGNNTVTINATINIPPIHCINITNPRTGPHKICYPGTASADLWLWASSISYPSRLNDTNWSCTLSLTNSSMYKPVDLTSQFNAIETFMNKLINESEVSRELIYPNVTVPTYALPNPTPNGYHQRELSIYCTNSNNYTVSVPITITIYGVGNNPWFASVPYLISPSDVWIINTTIVGDAPLLINWWDADVKQFLGLLGIPIARWLAEIAVIYGLLDGAAWFFGLPAMLGPVYSIMQGVIMELSLVLYLQIRAVSRLMQRAVRKLTKSIGTRLQGTYQALSNKHPRLAKALSAPSSAIGSARQVLRGHLGAWAAHHRVVKQALERVTSPTAARAARIVLNPWHQGLSELEARLEERRRLYESMGLRRKARLYRYSAVATRFVRDYGRIRSLSERGLLFEYTRRELSKLGENPTQLTQSLVREEHGGLVTYRLSPQSILLDWPRQVRRLAPSLARITRRVTQAEAIEALEELLGRGHPAVGLVRQYFETGNETGAYALALAKAIGVRLIKPLQAERQLIKEELGEIERALRNWEGFAIKHIGDKTEVYIHDARLTHTLDSLARRVGKDPTTASEALGKAIEGVTAIVRANLTRGALRDEFLGEVSSRLKPIREFMEAANKGVFISLNNPIIQRFIDFLGPESERAVREVLNTRGMIDKDAANEVISRLKPLINRRINEEVEAAKYIVAVRHHADEIIKEFARELGIDKWVSEREVKELEEFARRVTMSTFPMPRERVTNPELFGEFREVGGGRVVLREPLNMDVRIDLQLPKEILGDEELSKLTTAWLTNYYADRWHGWFIRSPGDAIYHTSLYKALTPEAEALNTLHAVGIDPARLDWGGLLDERERIEERMNDLRSRIKEAKDEEERAKLREELNELKKEYENTLKALTHWANAFKAFLDTLPSEERERIYNSLPNKLRDFIDTARDPRDVYEAYVKGIARKIEGMKRRMGRAGGEGEEGWVSIDDVAEMRELIRDRLPMLDRLIEPVRVELVDALTRRVNEVISELGNDELARALGFARDELGRGNLDNAIRQLRNAINHLREAAREREELARDVGRLDTLVRQLEAINALDRLMRT